MGTFYVASWQGKKNFGISLQYIWQIWVAYEMQKGGVAWEGWKLGVKGTQGEHSFSMSLQTVQSLEHVGAVESISGEP